MNVNLSPKGNLRGHGPTMRTSPYGIKTTGLERGRPSKADRHLEQRGGAAYLKAWGSRPERTVGR